MDILKKKFADVKILIKKFSYKQKYQYLALHYITLHLALNTDMDFFASFNHHCVFDFFFTLHIDVKQTVVCGISKLQMYLTVLCITPLLIFFLCVA